MFTFRKCPILTLKVNNQINQNKMDLKQYRNSISTLEVALKGASVKIMKGNIYRKMGEVDRYRKRRREENVVWMRKRGRGSELFIKPRATLKSIYSRGSQNTLLIAFIMMQMLSVEPQQLASNNSKSNIPFSAQPPSQLFLAPISQKQQQQIQQAPPISLVSGLKKSEPEEDDGGFIMKTLLPTLASYRESNQSPSSGSGTESNLDSVTLTTSAAITSADELALTTTLAPPADTTSNNGLDQSGSIPIDANRQQFLTHDQLSLNTSNTDENIYLNGFEPATDHNRHESWQRAQSSRSGMSKVSHVSSLLSGEC